ncbi:MAG: hypothetical protein JWO65_317 [Sphingomonas bacterium]|jgi:hypothetical protein|nr:hypothetical protein [Sphingomonas bacterium]
MNGRRIGGGMMLAALSFAPVPALSVGTAMSARTAIAVFRDWGAFSEADGDTPPTRCFAIAAPPPGTAAAGHGAFASIASWPEKRIRAQLSIRLSRGHREGAPVTLNIGDAAFPLIVSGHDAWAHDRRQDALIVRAMRSGSSMSISTIAANGAPYADVYRLRGSASAIDAAMLACGRER